MKKILKLFEFVFFLTAFLLMFSVSVNAYIDPSVVTYTIQVGAGIVIAVGAVIGIYFRKAKKKINNKLGIDENKNKEVESDDILVDEKEDTKEEIVEEVKEEKKKTEKTQVKKKNNKTTKPTAKKTTSKKTKK